MRSLLASGSCILLAALSAAQSIPPQDLEAAPFPNTVYPGAEDPTIHLPDNVTSPPSYPAPWMQPAPGSKWADAYTRAQNFVKQLNLAEKVNLTTGVGWQLERCVGQVGALPRLGFKSLCLQDSPVGVRDTDYNSVFPAGVTIAATWDRKLMYQRGYDMGSEHKGKGVDVQLGPVVGPLGRSPAGGRNWEGFSPDPYLSGVGVAQSVRGIQDAGVMACTKHFILNEQEHFRQVAESAGYNDTIDGTASSNVDDVTMHELYLWPFAEAVRAGTASVMCSYNQVNNSYACQNSYALNHLLKNELGFQGFVMSDWGAQLSGVSAALAGMDMAMPGDTSFDTGASYWGANLTVAVLNGTVPEWRIDDMATRILAGYYYVGRDKNSVPINFDSWTLDTFGFQNYVVNQRYGLINEHVDVRDGHGSDIRRQAAAGTVLLKNNNSLPLTHKEKFIGVFGEDAVGNMYGPNGCTDRGCDNGTLGMAWGSGSANFPYLITPEFALQNEVLSHGGVIQTIGDNYAISEISMLARQVSKAIVFVNSDSGEGYINVDGNEGDRKNLTLWNDGDNLIKTVAGNCSDVVVVIHSTGPVLVDAWYENPNVTAILWAGVPGEQSGNSIADVLYGRHNPGGKLPFTMGPSRQSYGTDVLYRPNNGKSTPQINFEEGVFIDYRSFDKRNVKPIYEFGYGLSYTTFSYSDIVVTAHNASPYTPTKGLTKPAPTLGMPGEASQYTYPADFDPVKLYIYPYLNSTDLKKSANDTTYGQRSFVPPHAQDSTPQPLLPAGGGPGGNPQLYKVLYTVTATIKNTGKVAGDEVPQLYVSLGGPDDPPKQLRGFDRIHIAPGQTAKYTGELTRKDLSNWDSKQQNWVITSAPKYVMVGCSSRNLPLKSVLPSVKADGSMGGSPGAPAAYAASA